MRRRDLILGASCVAAAGAAYGLKPRREVSLLKARKLTDIVPATFGTWQSADVSDPLDLNPGTLSGRLYNQLLVRLYSDTATGNEVFVLMAHGERQTDALQLHRPEVCYPAFGYTLVENQPLDVPLQGGRTVSSRRILAQIDDRREAVIYWTRIGQYIPRNGAEQREARFRLALNGVVPDGILCRFSTSVPTEAPVWPQLEGFIDSLMMSVSANARDVFLGASGVQHA